ncbi:hypothetical protein BKA70DRAFT_439624 [Coprinopsis sp. MPI-PUGE-AT-0042]|nr:hypothetical protein BKA70DRAFT_439624 [Coprinopsis sp. MPI-PUGE-AT-0042]
MPRSKLKSDSRVAKMAPTEPFLPTELMIEVLEVYIGSLPSRSLRKERRNLYLVCRLWRQIVDSTPSMWDRIYLHTNDPPRIPDAHLEAVLGTWIGKAGNLALELESHARSYSWADDHQRILANVLRGSASRWTTLMLNSFNPLDFAVDARTSRQRYPERPSVHWDLLETVHITNASCDVRPITHQIPPPKMPRLRTLTLVSGSHHLAQYSSIFPFKQLHQLTFIKVRTELIGPILQQCTQLEEFTFHFQIHYYHYGGVNTTIGVSPTPVLLKHLQPLQDRRCSRGADAE